MSNLSSDSLLILTFLSGFFVHFGTYHSASALYNEGKLYVQGNEIERYDT